MKTGTTGQIRFEFSADVWQYGEPGGWFFVSLPEKISAEIRSSLKWQEEGWGRMKAKAKTGNTEWETAIWFDKKRITYLLPLKADVRKKEKIQTGEHIRISLWV